MPVQHDPEIIREIEAMRRAGRERTLRNVLAHAGFMLPALLTWVLSMMVVGWLLALVPAVVVGIPLRRFMLRRLLGDHTA